MVLEDCEVLEEVLEEVKPRCLVNPRCLNLALLVDRKIELKEATGLYDQKTAFKTNHTMAP